MKRKRKEERGGIKGKMLLKCDAMKQADPSAHHSQCRCFFFWPRKKKAAGGNPVKLREPNTRKNREIETENRRRDKKFLAVLSPAHVDGCNRQSRVVVVEGERLPGSPYRIIKLERKEGD